MLSNHPDASATTYNQTGLLDVASKLGVLAEETVSGMDEVHVVGQCNLDDLVAGQVGSDRSVLSAFTDDIGLVGLLSVHGEAVLVAEDCHGLEGELVSGTEDSDGDLSTVCNCMA